MRTNTGGNSWWLHDALGADLFEGLDREAGLAVISSSMRLVFVMQPERA
jgi:hypothetical protein